MRNHPSVPRAVPPTGLAALRIGRFRPLLTTAAAICLLVALWAITHRFERLSRDAELYAVQAMAKIQTNLAGDIYLKHTSQDHFTLFSQFYAALIRLMGLHAAEFLLYASCTLSFFAASWFLAEALAGAKTAWLSSALLVATPGCYGAYKVFSYAEPYLSARSLAESMVVAALALHFCRHRTAAVALAVLAMTIHPLMALPGILLLLTLWTSFGLAIRFAILGVCAAIGISVASLAMAPGSLLGAMDANWLEVVRERSQFLFLQYWTAADWETTAAPIVLLVFAALVIADTRVRKLCAATMLVGVAGLLVAFVGGFVGPCALLVQGQAWRWMWLTVLVSAVLAVPAAVHAWRDPVCGRLCAALSLWAWAHAGSERLACAEVALFLWLIREQLTAENARYLRVCIFLMIPWIVVDAWPTVAPLLARRAADTFAIDLLRGIFASGVVCALAIAAAWRLAASITSTAVAAVAAAGCCTLAAATLPSALAQAGRAGSDAEIAQFSAWRNLIPPDSNVLILPTRTTVAFTWFTLQRPSYISVDQSSGVVFSPETAAEIRRRSEILLPVADPDWKIFSKIAAAHSQKPKAPAASRPLTAESLRRICDDSQLGFVIAQENVGFSPVPHTLSGPFDRWNLYDCRVARQMPRPAAAEAE